jgi:hypothetical protein
MFKYMKQCMRVRYTDRVSWSIQRNVGQCNHTKYAVKPCVQLLCVPYNAKWYGNLSFFNPLKKKRMCFI